MTKEFDTPILFLVFNRPETTQVVFNQIKKIKPKFLFVAADGPRKNIKNELDNCNKVKKIINQIDWDCELKTLYRNENLGCGIAVSSAINWFFNNVEYGIILEDDCLPNIDFFNFCKTMLETHMLDKKIMQINGYNQFGNNVLSEKYFLTKYPKIWGWATWKDRWDKYSYQMMDWDKYILNKNGYLDCYSFLEKFVRHYVWKKTKKLLIKNSATTWDYQWSFAIMINKGLCVQPEANLIQNIGFTSGTHYKNDSTPIIEFGKLSFPLKYDNSLSNSFNNKIHNFYLKQKFRLKV